MIQDLRLQNFRIHKDTTFEFEKGVNIIVGANGSGKTSILEAIELVCRGKSYKGRDGELIAHNALWLRAEAHTESSTRIVKLKNDHEKTEKFFEIDTVKIKRLTQPRKIPLVMFEPSHLQLLTESPSKRRDFIDDIIEQADLTFEQTRRNYKRTLSQRNALLKKQPSVDQLFIWDIRLAEFGNIINQKRHEFVDKNSVLLNGLYRKIAKNKHIASLKINKTVTGKDYVAAMLKKLESCRQLDTVRGFTSVGPHRDDIIPLLDGHELSKTGSRGEVRTMLLALKILELKALEEATEKKPILLLDDVFSELDGARRRALTEYLQDHQAFITTTDADVVVQHFINNCHIIPV